METKPIVTERLILRPFEIEDAQLIYEMDSNPEVLKFIGIPTTETLVAAKKTIESVQEQYKTSGIGRWAVIERESNAFVGWCGLKLITEETNGHSDFYELGYRFLPDSWGKGYATESAKYWVEFAFSIINCKMLYAMTDPEHNASKHVLEKLNFKYKETFAYNQEPLIGMATDWFVMEK